MASLWIKLEHTTPDKPEVFQMAEMLGIDPDAVMGKLIRVWVWADQQTCDGNAPSVTKALLNRITAVTGFADAMQSVGWLEFIEDKMHFCNFERHNGNSSKQRALTSKRVENSRNKPSDCNADVTLAALQNRYNSVTREEKRREENINTEAQDAGASVPPAKVKQKRTRKQFTIPTVQEVAEYVAEIGSPVDPQHFVDYYKSNGWIVGRSQMKDWQATVRGWTRREGKGNPYDRKLSGFNTAQSREQRNADAFAIVEAAIASSSSENPAGYLAGPQASLFHEEAGELHTLRH